LIGFPFPGGVPVLFPSDAPDDADDGASFGALLFRAFEIASDAVA